MSYNVLLLVAVWLVVLILFLGFIALLRYMQYREHIALLTHGIQPRDLTRQRRNRGILRAGLITTMVGLSLTIGLYPIGFILPTSFAGAPLHLGPWLLPGLIPLGVGLALIISWYLEPGAQISNADEEQDEQKVIKIQSHRDKERHKES